jgi:hypothetical protein
MIHKYEKERVVRESKIKGKQWKLKIYEGRIQRKGNLGGEIE